MKKCSKCKLPKDKSLFSRSEFKNKYGRCRECISKYLKQWREEVPDRKKILNANSARWQKANPEKAHLANKNWEKNNSEKVTARKLQWAKDNTQKAKESNNKSRRKRYHNDIAFRIGETASRMVNAALKKSNGNKDGNSIFTKVGWTTKELWNWLEAKFSHPDNLDENKKIWMNRENYGRYVKNGSKTWQLDHIIPQSDLPYSSMDDDNFKRCWALENLRPLESKQNLLDGIRRVRHKKKENK